MKCNIHNYVFTSVYSPETNNPGGFVTLEWPIMSTEGTGWPCCTAMFVQQLRMDKPSTGFREGLSRLPLEGKVRRAVFSWLQSATLPLDATKFHTLDLKAVLTFQFPLFCIMPYYIGAFQKLKLPLRDLIVCGINPSVNYNLMLFCLHISIFYTRDIILAQTGIQHGEGQNKDY